MSGADEQGTAGATGELILEQRFAIVPEWIIHAEVSDLAFRLYSVLLRYGQSSRSRMPSRALLARRLRKSTDSVDRAMKELVVLGAVVVERRRVGRQNLTNRYHLMSSPPGVRSSSGTAARSGRDDAATSTPPDGATEGASGSASSRGRTIAATPGGGVPWAGGRTSAAGPGRAGTVRVTALLRPDPAVLTESTPPPPSDVTRRVAPRSGGPTVGGGAWLAGHDLSDVARRCAEARRRLGLSVVRWTPERLTEVLREAVDIRGWPAQAAVPALLVLAADPATRGPARLSCPGPWWDVERAGDVLSDDERLELSRLEERLAESDGQRVAVQRRARDELIARGEAVTRLAVARLACRLPPPPAAASPGPTARHGDFQPITEGAAARYASGPQRLRPRQRPDGAPGHGRAEAAARGTAPAPDMPVGLPAAGVGS